ncbi:hypothetical protein HN51_053972 [Arachis hypogaea]
MARKKKAVRRGSHSGTHTSRPDHSSPIFLHSQSSPSQSPINFPPLSLHNTIPEMARTKTMAHRPGVTPCPTPTPPNVSQPSSSQRSSSQCKRPFHEEDEELPCSQARHTHGIVIDFHLRPVSKPKLSNPIAYKSFYADFPKESFDRRHFNSLMNNLFFCKDIYKHTLCPSKLVNLDKLRRKYLNFTPLFACQGWIPILCIHEKIYPDLVKQFYSNLSYKEGRIASFVKGKVIILDKYHISKALDYQNTGLDVYTSGKWDETLNVSYFEALSTVCVNIPLLEGTTPTHKSRGPIRTQLHRIINHIILPQSGSFQQVSFCDTLVLFSLLSKIPISFAYLLVRYMHACISTKNALPYAMLFTKNFQYYNVDFGAEISKECNSYIKRADAVKKTAPRRHNTNDGTDVPSHDEDPMIPPSNSTKIRALTGIMKNVLQELVNLTELLITHGAECNRNQVMEENALKKTKGRIRILRDFVEDIEAGLTDNEEDDVDEASDDSDSDA